MPGGFLAGASPLACNPGPAGLLLWTLRGDHLIWLVSWSSDHVMGSGCPPNGAAPTPQVTGKAPPSGTRGEVPFLCTKAQRRSHFLGAVCGKSLGKEDIGGQREEAFHAPAQLRSALRSPHPRSMFRARSGPLLPAILNLHPGSPGIVLTAGTQCLLECPMPTWIQPRGRMAVLCSCRSQPGL